MRGSDPNALGQPEELRPGRLWQWRWCSRQECAVCLGNLCPSKTPPAPPSFVEINPAGISSLKLELSVLCKEFYIVGPQTLKTSLGCSSRSWLGELIEIPSSCYSLSIYMKQQVFLSRYEGEMNSA